jgi:hypothetical protein
MDGFEPSSERLTVVSFAVKLHTIEITELGY